MSRPTRTLYRFNNTLAGRMLIGPVLSMATFYRTDIRAMLRGDRAIWRAYVLHAAGLAPVILWAMMVSTVPLWAYLFACYCAHAILRIRTYLEHRAHDHVGARTVVIEDRGPRLSSTTTFTLSTTPTRRPRRMASRTVSSHTAEVSQPQPRLSLPVLPGELFAAL